MSFNSTGTPFNFEYMKKLFLLSLAFTLCVMTAMSASIPDESPPGQCITASVVSPVDANFSYVMELQSFDQIATVCLDDFQVSVFDLTYSIEMTMSLPAKSICATPVPDLVVKTNLSPYSFCSLHYLKTSRTEIRKSIFF